MLLLGHLGTNPLSTIACRPGPYTIKTRLVKSGVSGSIHHAPACEDAVSASYPVNTTSVDRPVQKSGNADAAA
jgi:hypothetical protein